MTPPPVYLDGEGALLPDGTFVPQAAIERAVKVIAAACEWINALPPEARLALEVERVFAEAGDES